MLFKELSAVVTTVLPALQQFLQMQMPVHVLPFLTQEQLVVPDVLQAALPPLEVFLPQEQPLGLSSCKESEKSIKCTLYCRRP